MIKRVFLFLAMNMAVIILLNIVLYILQTVFQIELTWYWYIWVVALIFWFGWSFISLALSKWMAKKAYNIRIIKKEDVYNLNEKEKVVWQVVEELATRNRIKMPEVGVYESSDPNAFATWATKNSSLVAVSTGLLETMDKSAIEWVIGHEMAHVLNGDMVTMALLQWVLNTFVIFISKVLANIAANFVKEEMSWIVRFVVDIALQIIFWILASLIAMWFSRHREFRADEGSARFLGKEKMIAWLRALQNMKNLAPSDDSKMAAFQISTKWKWWIMSLFSSHPDLEERISRLENLVIN